MSETYTTADAAGDIQCLFPVPDNYMGWPETEAIAAIIQRVIDKGEKAAGAEMERLRQFAEDRITNECKQNHRHHHCACRSCDARRLLYGYSETEKGVLADWHEPAPTLPERLEAERFKEEHAND